TPGAPRTGELLKTPPLTLPHNGGGNWHGYRQTRSFLPKRRRPAMVSPAVTASSPSRIGAIGMPAGWPVETGWPVAARSEGAAVGVAALDAAGCVAAAGAAEAVVSGGVWTSITSRVGPLSCSTRKHAGVLRPTP